MLVEKEFDWAIARGGYRIAYGNRSDFLPEGEGRSFADVTLQKGWGMRALVRGGDLAPILGAEAYVDSTFVGATDQGGYVDIKLDTVPSRIEALYKDWHPLGAFPPAREYLGLGDAWHRITLVEP